MTISGAPGNAGHKLGSTSKNLAWPGIPNAKPNWSGNGTAAQNKNKTTGLLRSLDGSLSVSISIGGTLTVWM